MDYPTYREARPLWRQTGEVETHQRTMSAAERLARARHDAVAPASQPPVTLQTARRLNRSTAPARRENGGADCRAAAPSPPPAPPRMESGMKPAEKPGQPVSKTQAILNVLTAAGRPMWAGEVFAALEGLVSEGSVSGLLSQLRQRGVVVQDVKPGPYRLPDCAPGPVPQPAMSIPGPANEAEKINTPIEDSIANLARLVAQIRDERDALQAENTALRARIQAAQAALQEA